MLILNTDLFVVDDGSITAFLVRNITDYNEKKVILLLNILVSIAIFFKHPLQLVPATDEINKLLDALEESNPQLDMIVVDGEAEKMTESDSKKIFTRRYVLIRICIVGFTYCAAMSVPNVSDLIALSGAMSGTCIQMIIPPFIALAYLDDNEICWRIFHYTVIFIGIVVFVIGTISCLMNILSVYGVHI